MKYESNEAQIVQEILQSYGQRFFNSEELCVSAEEDFVCNIPEWFEDLADPEIAFCIEGDVGHDPFSIYVRETYDFDLLANVSDFVFGFLHEIGHFMTTTVELYEEDSILRNYYYAFRTADTDYFNLPAEKAATQWALQYLQDNLEEVKELDKKLKPYI